MQRQKENIKISNEKIGLKAKLKRIFIIINIVYI